MQVRYDALADRLHWQIRTRGGEILAIWLTRRMMRGLWPPLQNLVAQAGLGGAAPGAVVTPEAREMLVQAARERPLPVARFDQPFDAQAAAQPLGAEPLLPEVIDLAPAPNGLKLRLREVPGRRSLSLQLSTDLATALCRLIEAALGAAQWDLPVAVGAGAAPAEGAPPLAH